MIGDNGSYNAETYLESLSFKFKLTTERHYFASKASKMVLAI